MPYDATEGELDMLLWTRWQHGLGRRVADAETDVAQAVSCTREAVQKWRAKVSEVFGPDRVRDRLKAAELVGRHEARAGGRGLGMADYRPWQSDGHFALYMTSILLERDLGRIAARRRAAVAKRRVAKSEDK
jgi:hypothetical protein